MSIGSEHWRRYALGGAGGMFVAMGLGRFSYTTMVPALVTHGRLDAVSAGQVGTVNLAGFLLGALVAVPAWRLLGRERLLKASLVLALAGLAASGVANTFLWLAAWRGLIGFGTALIMVHSLALIAETAPADRRAEAASYVFAGVGFGIFAAGILVPRLLAYGLAPCWWGLFAAAGPGAALAVWGWSRAPQVHADPAPGIRGSDTPRPSRALRPVILAHALFSIGIAPHSIYWMDFLERGLGYDRATAGLHWSLVGVFAALGPFLTAALARSLGTARALPIALALLGLGVAAPALLTSAIVLYLSTAIFGAQPGPSSLMAARARDLGDPAQMSRVMRQMILSASLGGLAGGMLAPWIVGLSGAHGPAFLVGGLAILLGAVIVVPGVWDRQARRTPSPAP
ncbi:MAG: YbfB/YjiJ family MFS transporter [Hyphomicrobiaceae bacterium]|nr:YbfB/YjiJ family MFS transporter [Hyphomicrobiaceae bacterium]